jgi:phenylacetic acid degradation protein
MALYEFEGKKPFIEEGAFVHPEAVVIGDVIIDSECYIGAGAVLMGDIGSIRIGHGSNVQENCTIHTFPNKLTLLRQETHIVTAVSYMVVRFVLMYLQAWDQSLPTGSR